MHKICPQCSYSFISKEEHICKRCSGDYHINIEPLRKCPVDNVDMLKLKHDSIVIDKCPTCHGVWLDPLEVEQFGDAKARDMAITAKFTGLIIKK